MIGYRRRTRVDAWSEKDPRVIQDRRHISDLDLNVGRAIGWELSKPATSAPGMLAADRMTSLTFSPRRDR